MSSVPLAIVAALDDEIRLIRSKISVDARVHLRPALFTLGKLDQKSVLLVRSGIGRAAMERAIRYTISQYRPQLVFHVGYCGAADPALQPGDLLIATSLIDATSREHTSADAGLIDRAQHLCEALRLRWQVGAIVTVDDVVASPHDKAFLGVQHGAIGIDMESAVLAKACAQAQRPFLVVRAVLDPLDYAFPRMKEVIDEAGRTDGLALAGHLLRKPQDVLKLPRLEYYALQARQALAALIEAWCREEGP